MTEAKWARGMAGIPVNRWFRGNGTPKHMEEMRDSIVLYRDEPGGKIRRADRKGKWMTYREYAIVPLSDLNLDIEEPEPELVQVMGCQAPCILASQLCTSIARSEKGPLLAVFVRHSNKNVAIEAHNAAAEVLNRHGGV